ncbi:helix-turn-helix domain-containing protein [Nonomuraea sp. NPDC050536]|uniref:helix-turn-helix domain-containing protein n=1 Tax=Nonomuraea sp. NPDC050536 TaxID=3364366 RepID=UPI0037C697AE
MGRPENPITWDGPVAELARALRDLRQQAGRPTYRAMAATTLRGASVLAEAAAGRRCPTWAVTHDFVRACGQDPDTWRPLWERARKPSGKRRPSPVTIANPPPEPDPWRATTPREYVLHLRALRAWSGQRSFYEVARAAGGRLAESTMYDALNPNRHHLPPLAIVRAIVTACGADVEQWVQAWQHLRMREHHNTPLPTRPVTPHRVTGHRRGGRPLPGFRTGSTLHSTA